MSPRFASSALRTHPYTNTPSMAYLTDTTTLSAIEYSPLTMVMYALLYTVIFFLANTLPLIFLPPLLSYAISTYTSSTPNIDVIVIANTYNLSSYMPPLYITLLVLSNLPLGFALFGSKCLRHAVQICVVGQLVTGSVVRMLAVSSAVRDRDEGAGTWIAVECVVMAAVVMDARISTVGSFSTPSQPNQ